MDYKYWVVGVRYTYVQTVNCTGEPIDPTPVSVERCFSVWAGNADEALKQGIEQFKHLSGHWTVNPLDASVEPDYAVRPMTKLELDYMNQGIFNED